MMKSKKSNVWLYAVILFTSAFIVLLFAGYSQIRLNKNLDDYRSQVFSTETEKNEYLQNFASAQEMNEELNKEISKLENEKEELMKEIRRLLDEKEDIEENLQIKQSAFASLTGVFNVYLQGDLIDAVKQLETVDVENLDQESAVFYQKLEMKVMAEAGEQLFNEGFSLYDRARYTQAAEKLLLSFQYAPKEEFSDKCLYYLAYAELRTDKNANALKHMEQLIREYPESNYLRRAEQFVRKYTFFN